VSPTVAVVTFPGSNDDRDAMRAVRMMGGDPVSVWHADPDLSGADAVILPGGFSYGDYLRTGAIARFAPIMDAIREFADAGRPVLGVLPGALIRNRGLSFICRWVHLRPEPGAFGEDRDGAGRPEVLQIPIKHGEGQFIASDQELDRIERSGRVLLRYCSPQGIVDEAFNPNGAARGMAGIRNDAGNVIGMMPHPEHAVDPDMGPTGGQVVFDWLLARAGAPAPAHA
jgi:phosphoribosylformylglycinamidine synthase I